MTVAEMKYGVENSKTIEQMRKIVEDFIPKFAVIPIYNSLDIYAKEKSKLRKQGSLIDDFDILIGSTAIANEMIMVTNNVAHLSRLTNIVIEDWTKWIWNKPWKKSNWKTKDKQKVANEA